MGTITGQPIHRGDILAQAALIGLASLSYPMVVLDLVEEKGRVILGRSPDGPPMTELDGSIRLYKPEQFARI